MDELGFSLDLCNRVVPGDCGPSVKKTGTTIAGCVFKDGVVLGADTRSTGGSMVFEKNCRKTHYLADNIYAVGAGTSADLEHTTEMMAGELELLRMNTQRTPRIATAVSLLKRRLFRYQGYISAYLIVGGVDHTGPHLVQLYAHGSSTELKYTTLGSGSLAAMAVFESSWSPDLGEEDAKKLVARAIRAGIFNDLGSGGNIDLVVVRSRSDEEMLGDAGRGQFTGEVLRTYETAARRLYERPVPYFLKPGTTEVIRETVVPIGKK